MKFDIKKTVAYWREGAKYDLGVAEAMLKTKKYPYTLFMGHFVHGSPGFGEITQGAGSKSNQSPCSHDSFASIPGGEV